MITINLLNPCSTQTLNPKTENKLDMRNTWSFGSYLTNNETVVIKDEIVQKKFTKSGENISFFLVMSSIVASSIEGVTSQSLHTFQNNSWTVGIFIVVLWVNGRLNNFKRESGNCLWILFFSIFPLIILGPLGVKIWSYKYCKISIYQSEESRSATKKKK